MCIRDRDWYGAHGCADVSSVFVSFEEFSVEDPPPPHDEVMKTKIIVQISLILICRAIDIIIKKKFPNK